MDPTPERLAKRDRFVEAGIDCYPPGSGLPDRQPIQAVLERFDPDLEDPAVVTVAGRLVAWRDMGSSIFAHLKDDGGRCQVFLRKNALGAEHFKLLKKGLDLGDQLAVRGTLERTKMGEVTVFASEAVLLAKSLAVPPSEWYGLADVETRYRQRYVDLIANPETMQRFRKRSALVVGMRRFLEGLGFLEVETPLLHGIAGGAAAKPFVTHHNTLDLDLYLRIAPELHLKRLLVGGFERVFEIGRSFRNEGLSPRHNPEFTMLEAYWAHARMDDWIEASTELIASLALDLLEPVEGEPAGVTVWGGQRVDLRAPYARASYAELLQQHAGVDPADEGAVREAAASQRLATEDRSHEQLVDDLFGELVEPHLIDPTFVTDFPISMSPLAKARADAPALAERFELYVAGMEVANAFSELNDPAEQLRRFESQVASRDPEQPSEVDHDYVTALSYGMPPAAGIGIGVDRLAMLFTGAETIRDVILFPLLRPRLRGAQAQADGEGSAAAVAAPDDDAASASPA
ncbi:MAG: lysine--tRNA ligase [Planctomycetota bacterium]|nr:MAG: lysine--tRNA ligase [Planctomycetota bacterium]